MFFEICPLADFVVPADNRVKVKEDEKIHKYFDLARELKKQNKTKRNYQT